MSLDIIHMNTRENAEFIEGHGIAVKYYKSFPCQCTLDNDGYPVTGCECDHGIRYETPISQKMLSTKLNIKKNPEFAGLIEHGGVQFTIPRQVLGPEGYVDSDTWEQISVNDIIVTGDRTRKTYDILTREVRDTLHAYSISRIIRVLHNNTVVPESQYSYNTETKTFDWTLAGSESPEANEKYIVEFIEYNNYRIFDDLPMSRGTHAEPLPKKVVAILRQYTVQDKELDMSDIERIR